MPADPVQNVAGPDPASCKGRIARVTLNEPLCATSIVMTAIPGARAGEFAMRKLMMGIVDFRERRLPQYLERFQQLAHGQAPDTLVITCSDSRVVPELLASTDPGELFVMRNVGNLIPPATVEGASTGDLSEASAIEYSVLVLKVRHVVVCGHSECGAMKAALAGKPLPETPNLAKWLHHASSAVFRLGQEGPLDSRLKPY